MIMTSFDVAIIDENPELQIPECKAQSPEPRTTSLELIPTNIQEGVGNVVVEVILLVGVLESTRMPEHRHTCLFCTVVMRNSC